MQVAEDYIHTLIEDNSLKMYDMFVCTVIANYIIIYQLTLSLSLSSLLKIKLCRSRSTTAVAEGYFRSIKHSLSDSYTFYNTLVL